MQNKYLTSVGRLWDIDRKMRIFTGIELANLDCWDKAVYKQALTYFVEPYPWNNMAIQVELGERTIGHEIEAYINYLNSQYATGLWHKGLASSDLVECWIAICVTESITEINKAVMDLYSGLLEHTKNEELCNAITHGQLAEPIMWKMRFIAWLRALMTISIPPISGKIGGAVGTSVATHPDFANKISQLLGIVAETNTYMQIVPRIHLTKCLNGVYGLATMIEKIANDLRILFTLKQITFKKTLVGSSSMSHKINPYELERVIGMCKMVTAMIHCVSSTNADNWLERDLVHSSVEREFLPMIFNHMHYSVVLLSEVVKYIDPLVIDIPNKTWSSILLADSLQHNSDRKEMRDKATQATQEQIEEYTNRIRRIV